MPANTTAEANRLAAKAARNRAKRYHRLIAANMAKRDEAIHDALACGARQVDIANDLGVTHTAIQHAVRRHRNRTW